MRRIILGIAGLVVVCIAGVGIMLGGTLFATQGVADAADAFMQALQDNDMDEAYAMLSPAFQQTVDETTFNDIFGGTTVESWELSSRNVENNNGVNTGNVTGTTVVDGQTFELALGFIDQDGWKLVSYDFNPS